MNYKFFLIASVLIFAVIVCAEDEIPFDIEELTDEVQEEIPEENREIDFEDREIDFKDRNVLDEEDLEVMAKKKVEFSIVNNCLHFEV